MTSPFVAAVDLVIQAEGGDKVHSDPRDPGGLTKYGISQRAYPHLDIANLTRAEAVALYQRDYWQTVRAQAMAPGVALVVFDFAVNSGPRRAIVHLQRVLGVSVDGAVGSITVSAAQHADPLLLIAEYTAERCFYITQIGRPGAPTRGWLRRAVHMAVTATEWTAKGVAP